MSKHYIVDLNCVEQQEHKYIALTGGLATIIEEPDVCLNRVKIKLFS